MWRWLRDRIDDVREMLADALDAIRERLFGRGGEEEEELRDEVEREDEAEEVAEEVEAVEEIAGDVGDEYIIDLIEEIEEEEERQEQERLEQQEQEERREEVATHDDAQVIYDLFEGVAEQLAQNEYRMTTAELERAETLLEEAAALMEELRELGEDDKQAAIDLIVEALGEVERIVYEAGERGEDWSCNESRGPFVSYEDAVAYARSIPCPAWVYVDGIGWWWVCLDDCSPRTV